jgi:WD40 repeat protein
VTGVSALDLESVAFHPSEPRVLAVGTSDRQIVLWDSETDGRAVMGKEGAVPPDFDSLWARGGRG